MGGFLVVCDEVPERVMRGCGLGYRGFRVGLDGVYEIGKLHRVFDNEHAERQCKAVVIAFLGVKLGGKSTDINGRVFGAPAAVKGRKPDKGRRLGAWFRKEMRLRDILQ